MSPESNTCYNLYKVLNCCCRLSSACFKVCLSLCRLFAITSISDSRLASCSSSEALAVLNSSSMRFRSWISCSSFSLREVPFRLIVGQLFLKRSLGRAELFLDVVFRSFERVPFRRYLASCSSSEALTVRNSSSIRFRSWISRSSSSERSSFSALCWPAAPQGKPWPR